MAAVVCSCPLASLLTHSLLPPALPPLLLSLSLWPCLSKRAPSDPTGLMLPTLPAELQLGIARRLGVRDRLALGTTSSAMRPLVVFTAILEFKLKKTAEISLSHHSGVEWAAVLSKLRPSSVPECRARLADRKKGHLPHLYEALDPAAATTTICCEAESMDRGVGDEGEDARVTTGTPGVPRPGSLLAPHAPRPPHAHHVLPVGLEPDHVSLSLSDGVLGVRARSGWPGGVPLARFRASLVVLDLSRAQHLLSLGAGGLPMLRVARLPPRVRIACFDGCGELERLWPTDGATRLVSLRLDGCRKLGGASFRLVAPGGAPLGTPTPSWQLVSLVEMDLAWCTCLDAPTLAELLPAGTKLRSLGLRGLHLEGVIEALLLRPSSALATLEAIDLGFCSGLAESAILSLVHACAALSRCNLRAAADKQMVPISADTYNHVGHLMLARTSSQQPDVIENRRRPRHLSPRPAAPFYYLKRSRAAEE